MLSFCCGTKPPPEASDRSIQAGTIDGAPTMKLESKESGQIGYFSNHGWEEKKGMFGVSTGKVEPKVNQDRIFITPKLCGNEKAWLFACYDGNGPKGHYVAQQAGDAMVSFLESAGAKLVGDGADPVEQLIEAFVSTNTAVCKSSYSEKSGATATVVLVKGERVWCANVGDSKAVRAVAGINGKWDVTQLSAEHRPDAEAEKKRIEEAGGYVFKEEE